MCAAHLRNNNIERCHGFTLHFLTGGWHGSCQGCPRPYPLALGLLELEAVAVRSEIHTYFTRPAIFRPIFVTDAVTVSAAVTDRVKALYVAANAKCIVTYVVLTCCVSESVHA